LGEATLLRLAWPSYGGLARQLSIYRSSADGVKDACELARCVAPGRARGPGSTHRDSEAALPHTTPHCLTLIPRRRVPPAGSVGANRIKVGGTTERTMCVVCGSGEQGRAPSLAAVRAAQAKPEKRSGRPVLHAIRRTEVPAALAIISGSRSRACLNHIREAGEQGECIGACVRRIQAAERNETKRPARGRRGRARPRSGVK
jgi:hypothetical protein